MKILISAAEVSSDIHGARLLGQLKKIDPELDAFGIGGPALEKQGMRLLSRVESLGVMGSTEVLGRLPQILKAFREIHRAALSEKPDIAVLMDYPEFHFWLAPRLWKAGIPLVYYIPPKVWVWRRRRIQVLRRYFKKILCIFPFEEEFYQREGIPVSCVGNPLLEELPLGLSKSEARLRLGLKSEDRVVCLMPGSRPAELKRHLEPMLKGVEITARRLGLNNVKILIPLPVSAPFEQIKRQAQKILSCVHEADVDLRVSQDDSATCLLAADAALVKSGTSTLEAGLLGCPHAVVYKPGALTGWVFKNLIRYPGPVGLVNLVGGWKKGLPPSQTPCVVREILCEHVTAQKLADELVSLLTDENKRIRMQEDFKILRENLRGTSSRESASALAAREIFSMRSTP